MREDKRVPIGVLRGHEGDPQCGALLETSKHGLVLIAGDAGGSVCVWSCTSFRCLWSQRVHDVGAGVVQVVVVPRDSSGGSTVDDETCWASSSREDIMVTQSRAGYVYVWNILWEEERFECRHRLQENGVFSFTKCSVLGRCSGCSSRHVFLAYIGFHESTVVVRCAICCHVECTFDARALGGNHGMCTCLVAHGASSGDILIVAGYENGSLLLWSSASPKSPIASLEKVHKSPVLSISVMPILECGVTGSAEDDVLQLFSYGEKGISIDTSLPIKHPGVDQVVFRGDGKYIAAACWDGRVRIFHTSRGKLVDIFKYHSADLCYMYVKIMGIHPEREDVLSHARAVLQSLLPFEAPRDLFAGIEFNSYDDQNRISCATERDGLRVWKLLGDAMSGSLAGRLPPVNLPEPFQGVEKPLSIIRDYMKQIEDVGERDGGFLCKLRMDALRQTLDWSLSTCDPTLRSAHVVDTCEDIKRKHRMEKMDVMGKEYFMVGMDVDIDCVLEAVLSLTENDGVKVPSRNDGTPSGDSPLEHGVDKIVHKRVLDQMVQCVEKKRSSQGGVDQNSSSIELLTFPENQSGSVEELLFQVPSQWVDVMRQCLQVCSSSVQWDRMSEEDKSQVKRVSFCNPEALQCRDGICGVKILEECIVFCRTMIHKGLKALMRIESRFEELTGFVRGLSEGHYEAMHPKVQVLRNTVITFSTLMPNTRQLILCDKADWSDLFECLKSVRISIFQLSFPHHLHMIDSEDFMMDYDCFFITVKDAVMMNQRLAGKGSTFFKHFQRVILFESDPTTTQDIEETLGAVCKTGIFCCRLKPDVSNIQLCVEEPVLAAEKLRGMSNENADLFGEHLVSKNDSAVNNIKDWKFQEAYVSPFKEDARFGAHFHTHHDAWQSFKSPQSNYSMGIKENKSPDLFAPEPGTHNLFDKNTSSSFLSLEMPCAIDRHSGIVRQEPLVDPVYRNMNHYSPPLSRSIPEDRHHLFEEPFPSQPEGKYSPLHQVGLFNGSYFAESTPQVHKTCYGRNQRYTSPVFEFSPYGVTVPLQDKQASHYLHHVSPGISPSQHLSIPHFNSTPQKITPTRFWPPGMDPMNGLKHVERLYEEMRRPKARRRLQKGEKFRKLK